MRPIALTIAGSDPSGGAGLQADLKTFHQFGVYGTSVVTLLAVQNTVGVKALEVLEAEFVEAQLDALLEDLRPAAAKTGALGSAAVVTSVARKLSAAGIPLVVDPVLISKHGDTLADEGVRSALAEELLPRALLVTPNRYEASALSGIEVSNAETALESARVIARTGVRAVVVKGLVERDRSVDLFFERGKSVKVISDLVDTKSTHGTGCTFSAAITAELARGSGLQEAIVRAKAYVLVALRSAPGLGSGIGPLDHHASPGEAQTVHTETWS